MITASSRASLDQIFTRSLRANLGKSSEDSVELLKLAENPLAAPPEKQVVVFTIASYHFRLIVLFHVDTGKVAEQYFCPNDTTRSVTEVFGEIGNLCCGAINRELGKQFLHLGMSTPYVLDSQCTQYLTALKPDHVTQYRIDINGVAALHATLCLCQYAPLEFAFDTTPATGSAPTGALELF